MAFDDSNIRFEAQHMDKTKCRLSIKCIETHS